MSAATAQLHARRSSGLWSLWATIVVPALLCIVPALAQSPQVFQWATFGVIWGLWAISLNIVWGYAGAFSIAQLALGGIAGYTFAVLVSAGWNPLGAAALAVLFPMLASLLLSLASLRLSGFYFAILTIAFASVITAVASNWDLVGRTAGLLVSRSVLPEFVIFGVTWDLGARQGGFYALVAICFVLMNLLAIYIARVPIGRAMRAIRTDEPLAISLGMNPLHIKSLAFVLSAFVAGVAGVLQALSYQLVVPELFSFHESLIAILLVVIGGIGNVKTPIIAAVVYTVLYQAAPIDGAYRPGLLGLAVIIIILFFPRGIAGGLEGLSQQVSKRFGRGQATPAVPAPDVLQDATPGEDDLETTTR